MLLSVASVSAEKPADCPVLGPDTRFIDLDGNAVDLTTVDAIAFKEMESGTVLVYRRLSADAEALVKELVADGGSEPALLQADTWLMAQAASCQMRAGSCKGNCVGKQKCKRIKKLGKDVCTCMLSPDSVTDDISSTA